MTDSTNKFPEVRGVESASDMTQAGGYKVFAAMKRTVRNTASLVAGGRVSEKLGSGWWADLNTRTITWRPTSSRPPYRLITSAEALFLTTHEAGHLIYTGEYDIDPAIQDKKEFHFWVNGGEDIRIDRLNADVFAIYGPLCKRFSRTCIIDEVGKEGMSRLSTTFQVTFGFHAIEHDFAGEYLQWLDSDVVKFIKDNWPAYSAAAMKDSTNEMVAGDFTEIYKKLKQDLPENGQGQSPDQDLIDAICQMMGSGLGEGDGEGGTPAERFPTQSKAETSNKGNPMSDGGNEDVDQLANKNPGNKKVQSLKDKKNEAEYDSENLKGQIGTQAGTVEGVHTRDTGIRYADFVDANIGLIRRLSRRITPILRHNQMDAWDSGHRRGKLNVRRAHKSMTGNRNVFRKRTALGKSLYTVALLFDISGSMGGHGKQMANVATALMESLERAGVQVILIPWETKVWFVKRPEDRATSRGIGDKIVQTLCNPTGGTTEIRALEELEKEFARLAAQDRLGETVIFSVTDGDTNHVQASRDAMDVLNSRYKIQSHGIGLNFTPPSHYQHRHRINDLNDLMVIVPSVLKKMIRRG